MTLDREAARALFGVEPTTTETAGPVPQAAAPGASPGVFERLNGRKPRKGVDWRLAAPLGAAVLCIGAIGVLALPRDQAEDGKTVAATDIAPPPVATPAPVETGVADTAPAPEPAPIVEQAAAPKPAARPAPRRVAVAKRPEPVRAPSVEDTAVDVAATEPAAPPPPVLGAPAPVTLEPTNPPPPAIIQPTPPVLPTPVEPQS